MKIILYSQKITSETSSYIQTCINELLKYQTKLFILENLYKEAKKKINFPKKINVLKKISKVQKIDFLICFGGDGTMLQAAHLVGKLHIPITGINTGRLGFLANIPKQKGPNDNIPNHSSPSKAPKLKFLTEECKINHSYGHAWIIYFAIPMSGGCLPVGTLSTTSQMISR